jgi:tetratricopeptide (TPR) repeat protein
MVAMKSLASKSLFGSGVLIIILLFSGVVLAANTNTLNIKCVDESGKALAGAKVLIMAFGSGGKWQPKTADKEGLAKYDKLDDGAYRVVARPEGMAPGLYEPVILKNGAQESITVKCAAGDPLKKFYFEDDPMNQRAFETLKQALGVMNDQKYEEAEKLFQSSLELNPSNGDTLFWYGVCLSQQKKWDLAKDCFQKALDMATAQVMAMPPQPKVAKDAKGASQPPPQTPPQITLLNNSKAMLSMMPGLKVKVEGTDEIAKKNYKGAIAKLEEATKLLPGDPDGFYYLALAYGYDKQWDTAGKAIDVAIKLRPEDKTYTDLKSRLATNATLEKAKDIADAGDKAYNEKDYTGALKKYEEALPLLPDPTLQASVWAMIGHARTQLKQNDAAVEAYKRAISLAPQDVKNKQALQAHYETVAQQYLNDKQYDQGFAVYAEAGISIFDKAKKWAGSADTEDLAILAFQRVIKTEPQNAEANFELGSLYYFNKKDYARAKEYLTKYQQVGKDEKVLENTKNILAVIEKKK